MPWAGARVSLVGLLVGLIALLIWSPRTGQAQAEPADPRPLALTEADLPTGFAASSGESVFRTLPNGGLVAIIAFRRAPDDTNPFLIRNTVNSLPDTAVAEAFYA